MKNKIKSMLKGNKVLYAIADALWKFYYEIIMQKIVGGIFRIFPIKNNKIVICSYSGQGYGDNAKAIINELLNLNKEHELDIVWAVNKSNWDKAVFPEKIRKVKYGSYKYLYELATAKVWIDNSRKDIVPLKRKKQYYIQTWHGGIALKRIEKDAGDALSKYYMKKALNDTKMTDLMISNSKFCTEMYKRAFEYNGEILECGSPRNDILVNNENIDKKYIYEKLGINSDKKVVLYAPTFRKDENLECYNIDFERLLNTLNKKNKEEWIVVLRLHPNIAKKSKELFSNEKYSNIIDASNYDDMYELMLVSDLLITDYSSVMFEFSLTRKPVFLYASDVDKYVQDRGFYFDYYKLPYTVSVNNDELIKNIENYDEKTYKEKLNKFFEEIQILEKGFAGREIANILISKTKGV